MNEEFMGLKTNSLWHNFDICLEGTEFNSGRFLAGYSVWTGIPGCTSRMQTRIDRSHE